jgi:2-oxoglutarate dehydrogenase E1 component
MPDENSVPYSLNLPFVEDLYERYAHDPSSLPPDWRSYFQGRFSPLDNASPVAALQERVDHLIRNYRVRGHRIAQVDPLGLRLLAAPELDFKSYGFTESDHDHRFSCDTLCNDGTLTLREILDRLRTTYCRSIGVQFMHIDDPGIRQWLQQRMESTQNRITLTHREQFRILTRLTDAVIFEEFIRKRFLGAKSFSLEGSESLIPLLDLAIEKAGSDGIDEIVIAMAHRGRLNVLANILGKSPSEIFREFADRNPQEFTGRGDVKYHLGFSSDWTTQGGRRVHLSICFNPSHLEFVNPIALGRVRAKQDRAEDTNRGRGMALLIHGDGSFAGQGIIQESLNLSELEAYKIGGALHVVVNNQIAFTTPPSQATSSTYCTDVAKMLQIPIFHVNGENPEAVAQVVTLAMDFRRTFKKDVVIDLFCYRKLGHSEADEPSFTQPVLYKTVGPRKSVREGYLDHLLELGNISRREADEIVRLRNERLQDELSQAEKSQALVPVSSLRGVWAGFAGGPESSVAEADTGVDQKELVELLEAQTRLPEGFHVHPKLKTGMAHRAEMAKGERRVDWASAETLAFATLANEGFRIRLTGEDSERGTFGQRHAVLHDTENDALYVPLQNLSPYQAPVEILNSPVSEAGVLGFEYGYSLDWPDGLIAWEAQYGDFCNAGQVIIDQFISSAEDKWRRLSGLVLLLPHGFEGSGPEHSSARLERFLQLAAEDNIQIVCPTTPAQYFHLLRRQVLRRWRKPLIVMTPKSLLRHPGATSSLEDLARGRFQQVLADRSSDRTKVRRVLVCCGKIHYDLVKTREERALQNEIDLVRLEQLYPMPESLLTQVFKEYASGTPVTWVQEEPENMGAWPYLRNRFGDQFLKRFPFSVCCRAASASPATGSTESHKREQQDLITEAFQM